jgi:hypothetical protein
MAATTNGPEGQGASPCAPRSSYATARSLAEQIATLLGPESPAEPYEQCLARSLVSTLIEQLDALDRPRVPPVSVTCNFPTASTRHDDHEP